jgi:hypothetical protein
MTTLELFSDVALLRDLPEHGLLRGQVGTVVEVWSPADAEVEFVDSNGQTYGLLALKTEDLIRLYHEPLGQIAA